MHSFACLSISPISVSKARGSWGSITFKRQGSILKEKMLAKRGEKKAVEIVWSRLV